MVSLGKSARDFIILRDGTAIQATCEGLALDDVVSPR